MDTILKHRKSEKDYVLIGNELAQNNVLTYEAKGLLIELLSRPTNWRIIKSQLMREHTKERKINRIVQELTLHGYMRSFQTRSTDNSRITGSIWMVSHDARTDKSWDKYLESLEPTESRTRTPRSLESTESRTTKEIKTTKKEQDTESLTNTLVKGTSYFSKLSRKKKDIVEIIYEHWNYHKGETLWRGHNKITDAIAKGILETVKLHGVDKVAEAIDNYAEILTEEKYYWTCNWGLSDFLTKEKRGAEGKPKQYTQFLPKNFKKKKYLGFGETTEREIIPLFDPEPELTKQIISGYLFHIHSSLSEYNLTVTRKNKFIQATERMIKYFSPHSSRIPKISWVRYLMECLNDNYWNKNLIVELGHLGNDHTWDTLMNHYMRGLGDWKS